MFDLARVQVTVHTCFASGTHAAPRPTRQSPRRTERVRAARSPYRTHQRGAPVPEPPERPRPPVPESPRRAAGVSRFRNGRGRPRSRRPGPAPRGPRRRMPRQGRARQQPAEPAAPAWAGTSGSPPAPPGTGHGNDRSAGRGPAASVRLDRSASTRVCAASSRAPKATSEARPRDAAIAANTRLAASKRERRATPTASTWTAAANDTEASRWRCVRSALASPPSNGSVWISRLFLNWAPSSRRRPGMLRPGLVPKDEPYRLQAPRLTFERGRHRALDGRGRVGLHQPQHPDPLLIGLANRPRPGSNIRFAADRDAPGRRGGALRVQGRCGLDGGLTDRPLRVPARQSLPTRRVGRGILREAGGLARERQAGQRRVHGRRVAEAAGLQLGPGGERRRGRATRVARRSPFAASVRVRLAESPLRGCNRVTRPEPCSSLGGYTPLMGRKAPGRPHPN